MTIYLAGPMTGIPLWNFPAFYAAEERLRAVGHDVFNPAAAEVISGFDPDTKELPDGFYRRALGRDLKWICDHAEAVAVLPGWERSKGATTEVMVAMRIGVPVLDAAALLPIDEARMR